VEQAVGDNLCGLLNAEDRAVAAAACAAVEARQRGAAAAVRAREAALAAAGIVADHAYSVLALHETAPAAGGAGEVPSSSVRLLQLRNPWSSGASGGRGGGGAWTGRWSDDHPIWSSKPGLRHALNACVQADTGVFWMQLEDFASFFDHVVVARVHKNWSTLRVSLPAARPGWSRVPVLRLRVERSTAVELSAYGQPTHSSPPPPGRGGGGGRGKEGLAVGVGVSSSPLPEPVYVRDLDAYMRDIGFAVVTERRLGSSAGSSGGGAADAVAAAEEAASLAAAPGDPALAFAATGLALVGGAGRVLDPCVHSRLTLRASATPYFVVPMSFAGYSEEVAAAAAAAPRGSLGSAVDASPPPPSPFPCSAAGEGGAGPHCSPACDCVVLAVRSELPVVAEVVEVPLTWLARAAACQTISVGTRSAFTPETAEAGAALFTLSEDAGARVAAVNTHAVWQVRYEVRLRNLRNLLSSRGGEEGGGGRLFSAAGTAAGNAVTVDVLPPQCAQLLAVLSPGRASSGWGGDGSPLARLRSEGRAWACESSVVTGTTDLAARERQALGRGHQGPTAGAWSAGAGPGAAAAAAAVHAPECTPGGLHDAFSSSLRLSSAM